jgi:hypothetical protein
MLRRYVTPDSNRKEKSCINKCFVKLAPLNSGIFFILNVLDTIKSTKVIEREYLGAYFTDLGSPFTKDISEFSVTLRVIWRWTTVIPGQMQ